MAVNVLVLGDGTGGLVVSNLLRQVARRKGVEVNVRLIGNSPLHTYQPGLLFLPFRKPGYRSLAVIQRRNSDFVGAGVGNRWRRVLQNTGRKRSGAAVLQVLNRQRVRAGSVCRGAQRVLAG